MKTRLLLNLAGLVATFCVVGSLAIIFPFERWTYSLEVSGFLFALAVGNLFYVPSLFLKNHTGNDAHKLAIIGPRVVVVLIQLALTLASLHYAILSLDLFSYVIDIVTVSFIIISFLILNATTEIIEDVVKNHSKISNHVKWQTQLIAVKSNSRNLQVITVIESILESLRYSASDLPNGVAQDVDISNCIEDIKGLLEINPEEDICILLGELKKLIELRNVALRSERSKA